VIERTAWLGTEEGSAQQTSQDHIKSKGRGKEERKSAREGQLKKRNTVERTWGKTQTEGLKVPHGAKGWPGASQVDKRVKTELPRGRRDLSR